jgi:hypothetical protein
MDRQIAAIRKSLATHIAVLNKLKKEVDDLKFDLSVIEHENQAELDELTERYNNELKDVSKFFNEREMYNIHKNSIDYNPFIPKREPVFTAQQLYEMYSNDRS